MKLRPFLLVFLFIIACSNNKNEPVNPVLAVTGTVKYHPGFPSDFVAPRNVEVWLPEGYEQSEERYQVLYMHDGQNVFNPETSYNGNDWMVDEVMTELITAGAVSKTIVVAVWNSGQTRFPEYMPQKPADVMNSKQVSETISGRFGKPIFSDDYLVFLTSELKPFIDENYRTKPEREFTSIMGSSMGGLISLYAMLEYPDIFGAAGCVSTHWIVPELGEPFMEYVSQNLPEPSTHKIYFDFGTLGLDKGYEPSQTKVDAMMEAAGYERGKNWVTKKFTGHDHKEQYWAMRVAEPLSFLLK